MTARHRILYVTHNGLTEPLGRRQVLPYLVGLSARPFDITVLSFEKSETASPSAVRQVSDIMTEAAISWRALRYHNRPRVLGTALDIVRGTTLCQLLVRRAALVHARSTVPAFMAWAASRASRTPWVFDVRGLLAQEYVDAGHWSADARLTRLTSAVEARLLIAADGVVTLTERVARVLAEQNHVRPHSASIVIPCSVDLEVFRPSAADRRNVRGELGWGDEPVLVYSGSLGSWYRLAEMLDFFTSVRRAIPTARFLILTPHMNIATDMVSARGLQGSVVTRRLSPEDVPRHLAAADAGVCFLGPHSSKVASSPTKYGEYLASGLPVVTNPWIGDAEDHATEPCWILVDRFSTPAYDAAAASWRHLLLAPEATRTAARALARREFALTTAVERYESLYRRLLAA